LTCSECTRNDMALVRKIIYKTKHVKRADRLNFAGEGESSNLVLVEIDSHSGKF
ncbi:hypothetical protein L9F63_013782, partial [Diploptera punctata]